MDGKGNEYTGFSEYAFPMRETMDRWQRQDRMRLTCCFIGSPPRKYLVPFKSDPENHQCNCSLSAAGLLGPAFDCRMSGPHAENVGHAL